MLGSLATLGTLPYQTNPWSPWSSWWHLLNNMEIWWQYHDDHVHLMRTIWRSWWLWWHLCDDLMTVMQWFWWCYNIYLNDLIIRSSKSKDSYDIWIFIMTWRRKQTFGKCNLFSGFLFFDDDELVAGKGQLKMQLSI